MHAARYVKHDNTLEESRIASHEIQITEAPWKVLHIASCCGAFGTPEGDARQCVALELVPPKDTSSNGK